jgi:crotonobetainyl-CoA:carnitine CoA-transferase CaiB-like acyl-CoA transferase
MDSRVRKRGIERRQGVSSDMKRPGHSPSLYAHRDDEPGALAGVRVVDLTLVRAGPTCVRQLADLGADVIQVANPRRFDLGGSDAHNLHRAKRSIVLDLKQDAGRAALLRLCDRADVLVENFRSNVKQKLDIGPETLMARNPRLVYASISGFGQDGPYGDRPGLDPIVQGMGGLMSVTGPPGGGPWRAGIAISDTAAGTFLTQGILAALYARERTGRGQWVHTSLLESMINFMDFQAMRWLVDGVVPPQAGNDHPTVVPMGTFETRDGHVNVAAVMDWEGFVRAIDGELLFAGEARFADAIARIQNRAALRDVIQSRLIEQPTEYWLERFLAAGLPCGPVLSMDEVFADPQVEHLELTRSVTHATEGELRVLRHPVTMSETPVGVRGAPPLPGADTDAVLREIGYDEDEIEALVASGAATRERKESRDDD